MTLLSFIVYKQFSCVLIFVEKISISMKCGRDIDTEIILNNREGEKIADKFMYIVL